MWTEMLKSPDFLSLDPETRYIWMALILMAGDSDRPGSVWIKEGVPYTPEQLAKMISVKTFKLQGALVKLADLHMIRDRQGEIVIINWGHYQSDYQRVRDWRKKKRETDNDTGSETAKDTPERNGRCNAVEEEEDVDVETDKDKSKSKDGAAPKPGATPPPSDTFLTYPCSGRGPKEYHLTESKVVEYEAAYPAVPVRQELRALLQWCKDNWARRKTHRGMPAFLNRNLSRKQDRPAVAGGNGRRHPGANKGDKYDKL